MIGDNELRLNESTMIEAIQEYLDKRYRIDCPVVKGVKFQTGLNPGDRVFVVSVGNKPQDDNESEDDCE